MRKALDEIDRRASRLMASDPGMQRSTAVTLVLGTPEGRKLYKRSLSEPRHAPGMPDRPRRFTDPSPAQDDLLMAEEEIEDVVRASLWARGELAPSPAMIATETVRVLESNPSIYTNYIGVHQSMLRDLDASS